MEEYARHQAVWRILYRCMIPWISRKFHLRHEEIATEGPMLLIPNHVSAWDPLLVASCLPHKQVYYVASEHLFRLGPVTRLLQWLVAPIPRRKASLGTDTVKSCLRHLRAGHSVCLFAEGEQSWDGLSQSVFPATGKLVKSAGVTLVTCRIEGGYLSLPRWGHGIRKGHVLVHPVGVYPPEALKAMTPDEINTLINRDISENAWLRQREKPVVYRGRRPAEGLETAVYLCPSCRRISELKTKNDRISCSCGFTLRYSETGFFEPDAPFPTVAEWDAWQKAELRRICREKPDLLFSDKPVRLSRIDGEHRETPLASGALEQYKDRLCCGAYSFPLSAIRYMAMVQADLLLLSCEDGYYQIRTGGPVNLRKHLEIWKER